MKGMIIMDDLVSESPQVLDTFALLRGFGIVGVAVVVEEQTLDLVPHIEGQLRAGAVGQTFELRCGNAIKLPLLVEPSLIQQIPIDLVRESV